MNTPDRNKLRKVLIFSIFVWVIVAVCMRIFEPALLGKESFKDRFKREHGCEQLPGTFYFIDKNKYMKRTVRIKPPYAPYICDGDQFFIFKTDADK